VSFILLNEEIRLFAPEFVRHRVLLEFTNTVRYKVVAVYSDNLSFGGLYMILSRLNEMWALSQVIIGLWDSSPHVVLAIAQHHVQFVLTVS
jgi:hypothetical protein